MFCVVQVGQEHVKLAKLILLETFIKKYFDMLKVNMDWQNLTGMARPDSNPKGKVQVTSTRKRVVFEKAWYSLENKSSRNT